MEESILNSVKADIGISYDYDAFDQTLIQAINTALYVLWQLGVGKDPSKPFKIEDDTAVWSDFVDDGLLEAVKTDISLRVKMIFDPPTSSFLADNIRRQIEEYETRLTWGVDEYNNYYK